METEIETETLEKEGREWRKWRTQVAAMEIANMGERLRNEG